MNNDNILVWRYLWGGKGFGAFTTFASLLSMTLSVAVLILVSGVMAGFEKNFVDKMAAVEGNLQLYPNSTSYKEIAQKLRQNPRYGFVLEKLNGYALALGKHNTAGVLVVGTDLAQFLTRTHAQIQSGKSNSDGVLLGERLAKRLAIKAGENIRILLPDTTPSPFGWIPNYMDLKVAALINTGSNLDSNLVVITLAKAEQFWPQENAVIEISTADWRQEKSLLQDQGFVVQDWLEHNEGIRTAMETEKHMMIFVLFLIIILAAFNIALGIAMLVQEKAREIALLKAFGYSGLRIFFIFIKVSLAIGFIGVLAGTILGLLVGYRIDLVQYIMELILRKELYNSKIYVTTRMSWFLSFKELGLFGGGTVVLTVLCGIIPALKAYNANIMEVLRNDL